MPGARDIVLAESGEILFRVTQDGFDSGGGGAASAHVDEIAGDIGGGGAVFFDEAQHDFEIGSGADFRNEGAVLLVAAAATVECDLLQIVLACNFFHIFQFVSVANNIPNTYSAPY